jgi:formate hydrogenlyase transcriptional activator
MLSAQKLDLRQPVRTFAPAPDFHSVLPIACEGAPHGIIVAGEDGRMLFVNASASSIFGYAPGELIGRPLSSLLPYPTEPDDEWAAFWSSAESRTMIAGRTVAAIRRDGMMVPLEIGLNSVTTRAASYVVVSIRDITERLDLEARLAAATNAHLRFQRLVADVAARFTALDPPMVDDAISDSLRQIGEALQLDWAMLWRKKRGEAVAIPTHQWVQTPCRTPLEPLPVASIPFVVATLEAGKACCFATVDDVPDPADREVFRQLGLRCAAVMPLAPTSDGELGALALGSMTREQEWTPTVIERLRLVAGVIGQAFARKAGHTALQDALDEIRRLRDRLSSENVELRREVKGLRTSRLIVSESAAIQQVLAQIEQVAPTPATVLLLGETGTGKEVMGQAIHDLSPRHQRTMIRVSCAAIPTALIESELFGRERGAFTGALSRQIGRFEAANQSTLFLDEIGDLPMEVQVKLLRVLQERVIERLGSTQPIKVDVRIIAATNRNLEDAVRDKTFREDLFYRLNVFPIVVPPLREHTEDVPALVWSFIDEFSKLFGKNIESISKDSVRDLQRYPWPGNVRELRNVIERAVIVSTGRQLVVTAPRLGDRPMPQAAMTLSALEVDHIRAVLESTNWRVRGVGGAAERLGLKPTTLESRMARLGIVRRKAS